MGKQSGQKSGDLKVKVSRLTVSQRSVGGNFPATDLISPASLSRAALVVFYLTFGAFNFLDEAYYDVLPRARFT